MFSLGTIVNHAAEGIAFGTPLESGSLRRGLLAKVADVALVLCHNFDISNPLSGGLLAYDCSGRFKQLLGGLARSARFSGLRIRL